MTTHTKRSLVKSTFQIISCLLFLCEDIKLAAFFLLIAAIMGIWEEM